MVQHTYGDGQTFEFNPEAPEIPCPSCFVKNYLLSLNCGECGFKFFKASERTLKQIKDDKGLEQQIRECNRSQRSKVGALKQSMKSHKKYGKKNHPITNLPFTSILDRDPLYRYRMMSSNWTRDMCEPLQKLLETDLLGDKPSYRTAAQINAAKTTYVTHPELGSKGNAWAEAANYRSPDWTHIKSVRGQFREGLAVAREGVPVIPWVASTLQDNFGMEVQSIEEP